jgi:hypothetical protein
MTNPMIRIHNLETDEVIDREMTKAEYAEHLAALKPKPLTEEEQKAAADKAAAQAKLEALGLTTEDLKALGL